MSDSEHPAKTFRVACIVLAAGAGTRFGEPKAGAELGPGVRFIDAVVQTAREAGADPIVVVIPPGFVAPAGTIAVINAKPLGEQIASLRLGLSRLVSVPVAGALAWPVDHPYADLESARAVIEGARRSGAPIVVPTLQGRRGHPVYFSRDSWRELATISDGGARAVVRAHAADLHEVPVTHIGVVRDIDTRADMTNAQGATGNAVS